MPNNTLLTEVYNIYGEIYFTLYKQSAVKSSKKYSVYFVKNQEETHMIKYNPILQEYPSKPAEPIKESTQVFINT
ncbi:MAG: hypothetical protein DWI54_00815 [Chloroflexi bacterium]|nr:MAG: hypothetical protein DWI54_00815 [Chloroflexota bacterium]